MLALYASSLYRYVLFHSLVEMFSIIVAFVIFVLAWNTRRVQDNHFFLFIGIASLFSGALDLAHTFAYKGLGVFTGYSEDLATQLWIAFRYVFSLSFLIAPFFIERKLKPSRIFTVYFLITSSLFVAIFLRRFPACYVEGTGLTPFKIISEYIMSFIFLASLGLLLRKRSAFDRDVLRLVVLSLLSSIASELSFTHYVSVYGFANMLGHYFELLSYYLIYRAIVVTGVVEPSNLLFRNLKLSETAHRESDAKYRSLFENMIDGFAYHKVIVDGKGRPVDYVFLEVNSAFERLTGLKWEDIAGKRVREVLPGIENDPADWIGAYGKVALAGEEIRFEQYAEPLGKWFSVSAYSPMKEYFVTVFEDITERKRAEIALRESEEQFRTLADSIPNLAWWANADGYITWYNRRWYEYTGTTPEQMEGWGWQGVHDPKVLPKVLERWKASIATGQPFDMEFPLRGADGVFRSFLTRVLPLKDSAGLVLRWFGTNTEISALKLTEEALRKVHDELEARVRERTAELANTVNTLQTEVSERLQAEEKVLRLNRLYSVLSKINEAIVRIHDSEKLYEQVCRIAIEDGLFKMAWIGLTDPENFTVKPVASWGDTGGYLDHIKIYAADVSEGRGPTGMAVFEGTYSICSDIEHDTRMLPWRDKALRHGFRSSAAFPLRAGSAVIGALTIYSDTPQFFTADEINLLNSLVDDISFAIDFMANEKKRLEAEEGLRRLNEELEQRVAARTTVDMSSLAKAAADDLRKTQPDRRVEFVIADAVTVQGDPVMLRAALENLLGNAWKFSEKRESSRIEFGVTRKEGQDVYFVRDNGAGFDMAYANKLFNAFQRLHSPSEFPGLGIGLATVQRIVHRHGGRIRAEGAVDKGATFYFTL